MASDTTNRLNCALGKYLALITSSIQDYFDAILGVMSELLNQTIAFVLAVFTVMTAPLTALTMPQQQLAAVGSWSQEVSAPVVGGLYSVMSPTVSSSFGQRKMWFSGKPTKNASSGLLHVSFYDQSSGWLASRPVFGVAGHQLADPAVLPDPSANRLLMYYSIISNTDAASTTLAKTNNRIGQAYSTDGVDWIDGGIVIGQDNGIDLRGGWAPSALVVGSEIWLYYSTNYPGNIHVYRTRLTFDGSILGTERLYVAQGQSQKMLEGFNVDVHVSRDLGKYVLFLNKNFTSIERYTSDDGLLWTASGTDSLAIQAASSSLVAAPTVEVVANPEGADQYNLFFVGGPIRKGLFEGVYQTVGVPGAGTVVPFADQNARDYDTWASAGSDSGASSENSGGGGGIGGILAVGVLGIAAIVGLSFLTSGATAAADVVASSPLTGISFGGIVSPPYIPCNTGVLFWVISKSGIPYSGPIMWMPGSKPNLVTMSAPPPIGFQILGKAAPVPVPCFIGPLFVGAGLPILPIPGFGTAPSPI